MRCNYTILINYILGGDVSGKGAHAMEKSARFKKIFDRVFNHALEALGSAE